jgi:hypothetical protein
LRKSSSLEALEAAGSGSNLGFKVAAGQLGLSRFFLANPRKTSILLLEAQQHKKYTPLDDKVSSILDYELNFNSRLDLKQNK